MKAIVTGGAGFIGSHIAERLISQGVKVFIIDDLSSGKENNIPQGAEFIRYDISKIGRHSLPNVFDKADVIFHNAASKKNICLKDPVRDLQVNGAGTYNLLDIAYFYKIEKFVHASTGSVYGQVRGQIKENTPKNPVSYYGISKLAGENYVRLFRTKLNTTILRYFHVWGSRQENDPDLGGVVSIFKDRISKEKFIKIHGTGEQVRVFTHVDDVVNANIQSWTNPIATSKIYNCAASEKVSILQLAKMLMRESGKKVDIIFDSPLEGDIDFFDVNSSAIGEIGVTFMDFEKCLRAGKSY